MFLLLAFLGLSISTFAQDEIPDLKDNKGKEFWIMFPENLTTPSPELSLFITSEFATSGIISGPFTDIPFNVMPGEITTIPISLNAMVISEGAIEDKGIYISAEDEVTVYGLNQREFSTDAYLALPIDVLDTEYYIMSYNNFNRFFSSTNTSLLGIVATEDNTVVTITPADDTPSHSANAPFDITLNEGQTYQLQAQAGSLNDLTGTLVSADKPVAVFGGHVCADVPPTESFCDHLIEQMPPISTWGEMFATAPLATRLAGDIFRVLASTDNTQVTIEGNSGFNQSFSLNSGEFEEIDIPSDVYTTINANEPILVAQFSKGDESDPSLVNGDPFMLLIPALEQFQNTYTVSTPATGFDLNFINIVAPNSATGNITLDGSLIDASEFNSITGSSFSAAQIPVESGTHNLSSASPFGVSIYGFADDESYGYLGGQALGGVADVNEIILSIDPIIGQGNEYCFIATAQDEDGNPIESVRVDFIVSGANNLEDFVTTNAEGQAQFCYTPENTGTDNITASVGNVTATASVTIEERVPSSLTLDPEMITVEVGVEVCITGTVIDQFGDPLEGVEIFTEVDGELVGSGISDENGEVEYCFTPTETGLVNIVCYYEGGEEVTAEVTVEDDVELMPTTITLFPTNEILTQGEEFCITAQVLDQNDNPLAGYNVMFEITGVNEASGEMVSDENGEAVFCYTPINTGEDLVTASLGQVVNETPLTIEEADDAESEVVSFNLIDAENDVILQPLNDGDEIILANLPTQSLSIEALTDPDQVGSVTFMLSGPINQLHTENYVPYVIFGDNMGDFSGKLLPPGQYTLTAIPYEEANAEGAAGTPLEINFTIDVTDGLQVTDFDLYDASTDEKLLDLEDGSVINLGELDNNNLTMLINTLPDFVGSVKLELSGPISNMRIENTKPYAVFRNDDSNFFGREFVPGEYTLKATPYTENDAQGMTGTALEVNFSMVDEPLEVARKTSKSKKGQNSELLQDEMLKQEDHYIAYPVPFNDQLFIKTGTDASSLKITLYGLDGKAYPINVQQSHDDLELIFTEQMSAGLYMLTISSDNQLLKSMKVYKK